MMVLLLWTYRQALRLFVNEVLGELLSAVDD